jgi:protein SCO1/2
MKLRTILSASILAAAALAGAQFYSPPTGSIPGESRVPAKGNSSVRIDQKLDAQVPKDIKFTDENGKQVVFGDMLQGRPVLMLLIFFECPSVCTTELNNLVEVVNRFKKDEDSAGRLFDVVTVSIDPSEKPTAEAIAKGSPSVAKLKKQAYLDLYKKKGTERAWHFLTGDQAEIAKLADSIGYKYKIETKEGGGYNITHPAGLMVLTPDGKMSKYFLSSEYDQFPLLDALREARARKIGTRDDNPFFLACINVDPLTGQMSMNVMNTVKTSGVLTVLILAFSIFTMNRKYKSKALTEADRGSLGDE